MGRYFGVRNINKNHNISSYWKGNPPNSDEIFEIIKKFKWDSTDIIISCCYDTAYIFINNEFIEYEFYNNEDKYTKFIHYIEERYCSVPEKNNNIDGGDFDSTFFMN